MIFDSHSHLNFSAFEADRQEVVNRSLEAGVNLINVGSQFETSKKAVEMIQKGIYASVGLHPLHVKDEDFNFEKYQKLANFEGVVAIGETGLDAKAQPSFQKDVFLRHLDLAEGLSLPIIIHCRMAHLEMISLLKEKRPKGVIHCFSAGEEEAKQYLGLGLYLGFNGIIFKMDLQKAIEITPLEQMLIETDCPYLTPPGAGSERNEPIFISHVAKKIAEIKGISVEDVYSQTFSNAKQLFKI